MSAALIAVDWGTTNFRAYLLDSDGSILDRVADRQGILNVAGGDFSAAYRKLVGDWQASADGPPALMAGMIGSRNGWVEAPYMDCPTDPAALAGNLTPAPVSDGPPIWVVPGIACRNDGVYDVIRGEETQIAGAIALSGGATISADYCMPGTHCKWVRVRDGAIAGFRTAMTGEVFSVLRDHSILGRLISSQSGTSLGPAFEKGLDRARDAGGLLHHLFGVRAEVLCDSLADTAVADYLSGILIGHEIRELGDGGTVTLVGSEALNERYRRALIHYGHSVGGLSGEDAVVAGLWAVARQAGIVEDDT